MYKSERDEEFIREIIRLFVEKERKERFLFKLSSLGRDNVAGTLSNAIYFDSRCMTQLPKKPKVTELYARLKAKGADEESYVLTRIEELDGQIIPLLDALNAVVGHQRGDFVYCFDGQVGYYETDGWENFFIIHKPENANNKAKKR